MEHVLIKFDFLFHQWIENRERIFGGITATWYSFSQGFQGHVDCYFFSFNISKIPLLHQQTVEGDNDDWKKDHVDLTL